jgi:histone deacetylase 11
MYNIVKNIFISTLLFSALYGNGIKTFFKAPVPVSSAEKLPLIYDSGYNISFFGVEKLHPFDSQKYGRIFELLKKRLNLTSNCYYMPGIVSDEQLLKVHFADYLASLRSSAVVARIAEIPLLSFVPNFLLQRNLLTPMKRATAGRLLGARLALKHGWAINLSGGYHHAKKDSGSGFCFYADIPLAIHTLWEENPSLK